MKVSDVIFLIIAITVCLLGGLIMGFSIESKKTLSTSTSIETRDSVSTKKENWDSIKDLDFEIDMDKLGVVLVKRSFHKGDEVTLIQYKKRDYDYFACSREIHHRLIVQFQELLKKRETEDF